MTSAPRLNAAPGMNGALKLAVRVAFMIVITGPLIHLLKVTKVSATAGAVLFYAGFPLVILLLVFGGLWEPFRKAARPKFLLYVLLLMLVSASVMTFEYTGQPKDIIGNALRLVFASTCIFVLAREDAGYTFYLNRNLFKISRLCLGTSLASTVLMHLAAAVGYSVYFGLQTTAALLPMAYGLIYQRSPWVLLSLVALIGSGKRGTMIAAIAILVTYVGLAVGRVRLGRIVILAASLGLAVLLLYVFELLPDPILRRIDFLFTDRDVDYNAVTAGRFMEATIAFERLNSVPLAWLTGFGLGSALDLGGQLDSTVHFSPLGMVMIFGVPITILFYGFILFYIAYFFRACRSGYVSRELVVFYLVFVAELSFSMSAFTILQSYMLWLALTYLIANRHQHHLLAPVTVRPGWGPLESRTPVSALITGGRR